MGFTDKVFNETVLIFFFITIIQGGVLGTREVTVLKPVTSQFPA